MVCKNGSVCDREMREGAAANEETQRRWQDADLEPETYFVCFQSDEKVY